MTALDEFNQLKSQLVGLYDQVQAKGVELNNIQAAISQSLAPILDAPTPAIRKRLAAERRNLLDERELLQAELELLRSRLSDNNVLMQRRRDGDPIQVIPPAGPPLTLPAIPRR